MARARVAAVQMVSGPDVAPNLAAAGRLIAQAAGQGARLVALPENFYLISGDDAAKVRVREDDGRGPIQDFLAEAARRHRVWLIGGTCPIACADPGRIRSACLVYDDAGRRVARYDKAHLFRFANGEERHDETRTLEPGGAPAAVDWPFGRIGLSICYDLRFPEHYRGPAPLDLIAVPSAFTVPTGAAHWHVLLRARAIENLAYVIAPAQGGTHPGGRRTYGHSLIAGPWGEVLAELPEGEGVIWAEVDSGRLAEVRESLPVLENRRLA
jgi:nitrilase